MFSAQDIAGIEAALNRAAEKVQEQGRRLGTPVIVCKDGQIMDLTSGEIIEPGAKPEITPTDCPEPGEA